MSLFLGEFPLILLQAKLSNQKFNAIWIRHPPAHLAQEQY